MSSMGRLEENLKAHFKDAKPTLYEVCMSVGLDYTNAKKILYAGRKSTFDKKLEVLQKIAASPLFRLDLDTVVSWLAQDYLTVEVLRKASDEAIQKQTSKHL
jgi:hypothetical protein